MFEWLMQSLWRHEHVKNRPPPCPTPVAYYPPHDPDADPCRCVDCSEAAWDRLQEAQAESPSEWNQAYKGPIDKREMRRRE